MHMCTKGMLRVIINHNIMPLNDNQIIKTICQLGCSVEKWKQT